VVKALGEFLPLLTITEKSWKDIALAYVHESFDRTPALLDSPRTHARTHLVRLMSDDKLDDAVLGNVRWMLQKYPILATTQPDPLVDEKRCALTFESSIVSRT
jgi:hypothetical protein